MQHTAFGSQRSMMESLLQFDSLLDQDGMASGKKMPDDLAVSTVLRCIEAPTRKHLEIVMDDDFSYSKLKDKLILLDKNTKSWSGGFFSKAFKSPLGVQLRVQHQVFIPNTWFKNLEGQGMSKKKMKR